MNVVPESTMVGWKTPGGRRLIGRYLQLRLALQPGWPLATRISCTRSVYAARAPGSMRTWSGVGLGGRVGGEVGER